MKRIIALVFLAVFLVQCSTVPITGRKRLNFVNDAQVLPASFAQYKGFLEKNKLSKSVTKSNQIKRVGQKISEAVDRFMRANGMVSEANSYNHPNAAIGPRIPGIFQYYSVAEDELAKIYAGQYDAQTGADNIAAAWEKITDQIGRDKQIKLYKASLGL